MVMVFDVNVMLGAEKFLLVLRILARDCGNNYLFIWKNIDFSIVPLLHFTYLITNYAFTFLCELQCYKTPWGYLCKLNKSG